LGLATVSETSALSEKSSCDSDSPLEFLNENSSGAHGSKHLTHLGDAASSTHGGE